MGNELKNRPEHSAEYFGDTRDHWWNADFIQMVARHWHLERTHAVLDVGCGVGHWGRVLAPVLPAEAQLVGVDREQAWVDEAAKRAGLAKLGDRFSYRVASAEQLPFDDATFDVVTCQTLLIHVRDPEAVLAEMIRVTRPGGLVIAAEPTNIAGPLLGAIALSEPSTFTADLVYLFLACQEGKKVLGEGNNMLGESLPLLFQRARLRNVDVRQNDQCWRMVPPYDSPFERAQKEEILDAAEREIGAWDEATTRRYFLAGGGDENAFRKHWEASVAHLQRCATAIRNNTYSCAGGGFHYLAWGWRDGN